MLHDTDIIDLFHSCGVYALRRSPLGQKLSLSDLFKGGKEFSKWEDLSEGDILVWEVNANYLSLPSKVQEHFLLSPQIKISRHFGVYEGKSIISDLNFTFLKDGNQYPHLRFRSINDMRNPDFYYHVAMHGNVIK